MLAFKFILIAALCVTLYGYVQGKRTLPGFTLFMILVFIFEFPLDYMFNTYLPSNFGLKNYFSKLCVYYYIWVYLDYFKAKAWNIYYKGVWCLYILVTQLYFYLGKQSTYIDALSYNAGMILLLPLLLAYLYDVVYKKSYQPVFRDPYLYLTFGVLFFFTSAFPLLTFANLLITQNSAYEAYTQLLNVGNIFLSLAYLGVALCSTNPKPSIA